MSADLSGSATASRGRRAPISGEPLAVDHSLVRQESRPVALMPKTWTTPSLRRGVAAVLVDLIRDLVPFVQTGMKALDELHDRVVLRLKNKWRG